MLDKFTGDYGQDTRYKKGKQPTKFKYTYQTIADIVQLRAHTVWTHKVKGIFDPHDLKSVVEYINSRTLKNELREVKYKKRV